MVIAALLALQQSLVVDPLLITEAQEIWAVIGRPNNPVWPGWDARKTPILIYFPDKQDLLINHPKPPAGFLPYTGPVRTTLGPMFVKDGQTIMKYDGQNTSTVVNGIGTLVIADTLSTRRQWAAGLVPALTADPDKADEIVASSLFPDPYGAMTTFAHEAFHVYQEQRAPAKRGKELSLTRYPALSAENNLGFVLESDLIAQALQSKSPGELRDLALQWLAVRDWRRSAIGREASEYEDGTEFSEGTAKYVEYRTLQALESRQPARDMWLVQGFHGYDGMSAERDRLVQEMRAFMSGRRSVNNDLYGASPVRFRLYYSGMGIGALLDKLGAKWHESLLATGSSLTDLVRQALHPTGEELAAALAKVKATPQFARVLSEKQQLAIDGERYIADAVAAFDKSAGELVIDYGSLQNPRVNYSFTPFGILRIDEHRRIFRLLPVRGVVNDVSFAEASARPVLDDDGAKLIRLQLTAAPDASLSGKKLAGEALELPGVRLKNVKGTLTVEGRKVILRLS